MKHTKKRRNLENRPENGFWSFNRAQLARAILGKMEVSGDPLRTIARISGVNHSTLWRATRGEPVEIDSLVRICQWLGVQVDSFVERPRGEAR